MVPAPSYETQRVFGPAWSSEDDNNRRRRTTAAHVLAPTPSPWTARHPCPPCRFLSQRSHSPVTGPHRLASNGRMYCGPDGHRASRADGAAQVTDQAIARWMDIGCPAVAGMTQATADTAGDECRMRLPPCDIPPQAGLEPAASRSHIRLSACQRDGQVDLRHGTRGNALSRQQPWVVGGGWQESAVPYESAAAEAITTVALVSFIEASLGPVSSSPEPVAWRWPLPHWSGGPRWSCGPEW